MISRYIKYFIAPTMLCLLVGVKGHSQNLPKEFYMASNISDSLKDDANSVVRYKSVDFDIEGPGKCVKKVHSVVTVLKEKGDQDAAIVLPYNRKFGAVSSFEMRVYDADGKLIKKYRKGDLYEHAAEQDETLV